MERYKTWVRAHPSAVSHLDWLLYLTVWNPARTSGTSEASYEAYHAAIGLLSVWHQHIIEQGEGGGAKRPGPGLWLEALEQVGQAAQRSQRTRQHARMWRRGRARTAVRAPARVPAQVETIIELRSMYLEDLGKMSRYGPLVALECTKCGGATRAGAAAVNTALLRQRVPARQRTTAPLRPSLRRSLLKLLMWSQFAGHLYLRHPTPEDVALFEAEQGFQVRRRAGYPCLRHPARCMPAHTRTHAHVRARRTCCQRWSACACATPASQTAPPPPPRTSAAHWRALRRP